MEGACICVRMSANDVYNRNIVVGSGGEDEDDEGEGNKQGCNDGAGNETRAMLRKMKVFDARPKIII
jgi:hypothetical protein